MTAEPSVPFFAMLEENLASASPDVATCYLLGVSTRRVEKLAQGLGVTQLSKSQVSESSARPPGPARPDLRQDTAPAAELAPKRSPTP